MDNLQNIIHVFLKYATVRVLMDMNWHIIFICKSSSICKFIKILKKKIQWRYSPYSALAERAAAAGQRS